MVLQNVTQVEKCPGVPIGRRSGDIEEGGCAKAKAIFFSLRYTAAAKVMTISLDTATELRHRNVMKLFVGENRWFMAGNAARPALLGRREKERRPSSLPFIETA